MIYYIIYPTAEFLAPTYIFTQVSKALPPGLVLPAGPLSPLLTLGDPGQPPCTHHSIWGFLSFVHLIWSDLAMPWACGMGGAR